MFHSLTDYNYTTMRLAEDSIIGTIDHIYLRSFLLDYIKESPRESCKIILKNNLFSSVSFKHFLQLYLTDFEYHTEIIGNPVIITEHEPASHIIFIKSGEYEVYSNKSIKDLTKMIDYYKNECHYKDMNDDMYKDITQEYYLAKHPFTLPLISGSDVIGFYDYSKNNKYTFSVRMKASAGEFFTIKTEDFITMCLNNRTMHNNMTDFINAKRKVLYDRLVILRDKYIKEYLILLENQEEKKTINHRNNQSRINIRCRVKEIKEEYLHKKMKENMKKRSPLHKISIKKTLNLNHSQSPNQKILSILSIKKTNFIMHKTIQCDECSPTKMQFLENIHFNNKNHISIIKVPFIKEESHKLNKTNQSTQSTTYLLSNEFSSSLHVFRNPKCQELPLQYIHKKCKVVNKYETLDDFWSFHKNEY